MKILIIGGEGTIGKRVSSHLNEKHEILIAGRSSGEYTVDITKADSIRSLLESIPSLDSIICIAGEASGMIFKDLSEEDYYIGIKSN